MRRVRQSLDRAELAVCERIIACYCPYVLIRCARYTNGRRQAQQIGAYALVTACLMALEVGDVLPIGKIVETELRVIGRDVLRGARGEDWREGPDEPLLVGPWMQYMATALNALKRPGREVLILHHLDGLTPEDLARRLEQPVGEVQVRLGRAERRLAQWLATPDVRPALARFAAGLDRGWMQEVAACAMNYLSTQAKSEDR
jgi:hypothetical protein